MPQIENRPPQTDHQCPLSSGTATNSDRRSGFIETLEHRRFAEFCDACRRYGYIGLCYGSSGVGKTLSARRYSRRGEMEQITRWMPVEGPTFDTAFYTPSVVNSPGGIDSDIDRCRDRLTQLARRTVQLETQEKLEAIRRRDKEHEANIPQMHDWLAGEIPKLRPTYGQVELECWEKEKQIADPTTLILIDEADRLRMASLEQVRAIFDADEIGLILIGMPGLEKRLTRYPQFIPGSVLSTSSDL